MSLNPYFTFISDTVSQQGNASNGIVIERQSIELTSLRDFSADSNRVQAPKPVALKKVVPYIPYSDTVAHPVYNALTGEYELTQKHDLFQQLKTHPIQISGAEPLTKTDTLTIVVTDSNAIVVSDSTTVGLSDSIVVAPKPVMEVKKITMPQTTVNKDFTHTDGMLVIIIGLLVVFAWFKIGFSRYFSDVINASFNYFSARRFYEEANVLRNRVFHFMNLFALVTLSLFTWQWFNYTKTDFLGFDNLIQFLIIFGGWSVVYGLKNLALRTLDYLFQARGGFLVYNYTVFMYNKLNGFFLFPLVAMLPFVPRNIVPWLFKAGLALFIITYFLRIIRGIQIGFKNRLSIFYLILYLCALEILPVLILFRVIEMYL